MAAMLATMGTMVCPVSRNVLEYTCTIIKGNRPHSITRT